jgi:hypothetical protein
MRVCQFRHYGTVPFAPLQRAGARLPRAFSLTNEDAGVNAAAVLAMPCVWRVRLLRKKGVYLLMKVTFSHMTDQNNPLSQVPSSIENIPEDLSVEMRRIAHDLSNALEIIIQTSYLLSTVEIKGPAEDWLRMLDDGVQKAMALNLELRTYIKDHTSS